MSDRNTDILCVSETWLSPHIPDTYINIPNYKVFRCDSGRGAGVCLYVRETLNSETIDTKIPRQTGTEDVWVKVQCRKLPSVIVGCIYRHPKAPVTSYDHITDTMRSIILHKKPFLILGDLNDDLLSPNSKLAGLIKNNKLTQLIGKPTRITPNTATLLDVIITNTPDLILHCDVIPNPIADHELITVIIDMKKPKRPLVTKTFRDLKFYDKDKFCESLLHNTLELNKILATDNVNDQVNILTLVFNKCLDNIAPMVTREIKRPPAPWINNEIREYMILRNATQRNLKINRHNTSLQERYRYLKKHVKTLINTSKTKTFNSSNQTQHRTTTTTHKQNQKEEKRTNEQP